jgi:hypothetical protein
MSELLILYYKQTAVSNAGGKSMARPAAAHGPNSAVLNNLETIRNRARDQLRNQSLDFARHKIVGGKRDRLSERSAWFSPNIIGSSSRIAGF